MIVIPRPCRRTDLVAAVVLVLAACSSKPDSVDPAACGQPTDGTRLRAFYLDGDDGSREYFDFWYDRHLKSRCRFQVAADGQTRCLPFDQGVGDSFLDAACSQKIVGDYAIGCLTGAYGPPQHALQIVNPTECTESFHVFALGTGSVQTSTYTQASGGSCLGVGDTDPLVFYPIGDEVSPAAMVLAEVRPEGARLQTSYATGEDGSHGRVHRLEDRGNVFDSLQEVHCDPQLATDGIARCLPASRSVLRFGGFDDPQCTRPIALDSRPSCDVAAGAPRWGTISGFPLQPRPPGVCTDPPTVGLHPLGGPTLPITLYAPAGNAAGTCLPGPNLDAIGNPHTAYPLLEELAPSGFVAVEEKTQQCGPNRTSGSRLQAHYETSDDGLRIEGGFWFDAHLDVACRFLIAADGRSRCLPIDQEVTNLFSDGACTRPIASADPCPVDDPAAVLPAFALRRDEEASAAVGSCLRESDNWRYRVHRLGAALAIGIVYQRTQDGNCTATSIGQFDPPRRFYEIGEELPPPEMVGGTYRRF